MTSRININLPPSPRQIEILELAAVGDKVRITCGYGAGSEGQVVGIDELSQSATVKFELLNATSYWVGAIVDLQRVAG